MITPDVKIIQLDWEKGQMCNLFLAITSFAVIKSEQCVQSKNLNKNLIFFLNTTDSYTLLHTNMDPMTDEKKSNVLSWLQLYTM